MDAVKQRLAAPAVKTMAQRGTEIDSLPTSQPISPGESMLCKYMIVVYIILCSIINKILQLVSQKSSIVSLIVQVRMIVMG